jgi:hypothetical protein
MEEALTKDQIFKLDRWIKDHYHDAKKGDGQDLWPDWKTYRR